MELVITRRDRGGVKSAQMLELIMLLHTSRVILISSQLLLGQRSQHYNEGSSLQVAPNAVRTILNWLSGVLCGFSQAETACLELSKDTVAKHAECCLSALTSRSHPWTPAHNPDTLSQVTRANGFILSVCYPSKYLVYAFILQ